MAELLWLGFSIILKLWLISLYPKVFSMYAWIYYPVLADSLSINVQINV